MKATWRRLGAESRISLVGSVAIAFFLLLVALSPAIRGGFANHRPLPPVQLLHIVLVILMGWLFFRAATDLLLGRPMTRHQWWLVGLTVPVLAALWFSDWTLGCVWAATTLLVAGGGWGLGALALLLVNLVVEELLVRDDPNLQLTFTLTIFTVFAIYIPLRLMQTSDQLVLSREENARLHVDKERERISRDLHDIMGRTLVAVSVRQEAAARLLQRERMPEARQQLQAAHEIVADGQARLREITHGPTITDLRSEVESAKALCERTGIEWDAQIGAVGTPDAQRLCAAVLREAVTNMLKYAHPTTCWVRIRDEGDMLALSIVNDGVPPTSKVNEEGTGLATLQARTVALGGTLEALSPRASLFRVLMHVPIFVEEGR
ncbi:sensor histidine kinase [Flexivirga caeni]|uniref:Signal transduction histidine kinase subgroup 3 dimerisation and phosphoacceptor domain-containing protein n=1 Tax=Flexivirga caeni TaxID=2294115 RepID=A0A3M9M6C1_9MICO|nr:histidine kinase [Flexivirga caeni]RNI21119.1 hypothetical protein EFY87_12655 [Flexivirga caeni]